MDKGKQWRNKLQEKNKSVLWKQRDNDESEPDVKWGTRD